MPRAINLTIRADFKMLMAHEFHVPGSKTFDPREPNLYIRRLTSSQRDLLEDDTPHNCPPNRLIAFIVYGDGNIDVPMMAYYGKPVNNILRPNSSLALFYKSAPSSDIELVFYTRSFCVSYDGPKGETARKLIRELDATSPSGPIDSVNSSFYPSLNSAATFKMTATPDREKKLGDVFDAMKRIPWIRGINGNGPFIDLGKFTGHREGRKAWGRNRLRLSVGFNITHHIAGEPDFFPYIQIQEKAHGRWGPPAWFSNTNKKTGRVRENTIHSMYNTQGCWMLFRNYFWTYPDENNSATINFRKGGMTSQLEKLCSAFNMKYELGGSTYHTYIDLNGGQPWPTNTSYLTFLNLFCGLKYSGLSSRFDKIYRENHGYEPPILDSGRLPELSLTRAGNLPSGGDFLTTPQFLQGTGCVLDYSDFVSADQNLTIKNHKLTRVIEPKETLTTVPTAASKISLWDKFEYQQRKYGINALGESVDESSRDFANLFLFCRVKKKDVGFTGLGDGVPFDVST